MPKISVIIPVYNVEVFLPQCLDSILNQTFNDWECILVNDGSTDKSGQICDEYVKKDTRFKVIHQSNFGVSTARKTGLELSNGIWVSFIDSDDWIEPITFEKSYNIVTKSNSDVVCFNMQRVYKNKNTEKIQFVDRGLEKNFIFYPVYMHSLSNKLFNRKLFFDNKIVSDDSLIVCEDLLWSFQLLFHANKITYIEDIFYNYRLNYNSVCNSPLNQKKIDNMHTVYILLNNFIINNHEKKRFNKFIKYRNLCSTIDYLINPNFFNIKKFRKFTISWNFVMFPLSKKKLIILLFAYCRLDFLINLYMKTRKKN